MNERANKMKEWVGAYSFNAILQDNSVPHFLFFYKSLKNYALLHKVHDM